MAVMVGAGVGSAGRDADEWFSGCMSDDGDEDGISTRPGFATPRISGTS